VAQPTDSIEKEYKTIFDDKTINHAKNAIY